MTTIGKLGIAFGLAAGLSYAASFDGKLLDASCYDTQKSAKEHKDLTKTCAPTVSTTDFAIRTSAGKVYKLNESGNAALAKDVRSGVIKADHDGDMHASLTGKLKDGVVDVDVVNAKPASGKP